MFSALSLAEAAIARGDYDQCLEILLPLAEKNSLAELNGPTIRMLMVTAYMGKGDESKAISTCRLLTKSKNPEIRQQAKQLLAILEAPSLQRPENWSVRLPDLELTSLSTKSFNHNKKKSTQKKSQSVALPPTGETKALGIGFSTLVLAVLIGITILLSGCVHMTAEIGLPEANKVNIKWELKSLSSKLLPWQVALEDSLRTITPKLNITSNSLGEQTIKSVTLNTKEAKLIFEEAFSNAANLAGIDILKTQLIINEKNFLIGVKQYLTLTIDLRRIPNVPGLKLSILINPSPNEKTVNSSPLSTSNSDSNLSWKLKQGEINYLNFNSWRWSRLGVGTILVISLSIMTTYLQRIRLMMGFGFPELPP